jgi:hypothetical protein
MPEPLPGLKAWPKGLDDSVHMRRGPLYMATSSRTAFLDLDRWPAAPVKHPAVYALSFDLLPDGRVVTCATRTVGEVRFTIRAYPADWPANPAAEPVCECPPPEGVRGASVACVSGCAVVWDSLIERKKPPAAHRAWVPDGARLVEAPGLDPVTQFGRDHWGQQVHKNGKAVLASGEEVLVWDGDAYAWTGAKFEKRWALGAKGIDFGPIESVPWGKSGLLYLAGGTVRFARPGKKDVRLCADSGQVVSLAPGPEGTVLLVLFNHPSKHALHVWNPATGTRVAVTRAHLGMKARDLLVEAFWSAATRRVYCPSVCTFPDEALAGLRPSRPETDYQVPAK